MRSEKRGTPLAKIDFRLLFRVLDTALSQSPPPLINGHWHSINLGSQLIGCSQYPYAMENSSSKNECQCQPHLKVHCAPASSVEASTSRQLHNLIIFYINVMSHSRACL